MSPTVTLEVPLRVAFAHFMSAHDWAPTSQFLGAGVSWR